MSNQPNEPVQNYEIVNPTLEQQVRTLLPSVSGYGGLLRSTNTVIPVVDVTTAAEGSTLPEALQFALAFGSVTAFNARNSTDVIANTPGFYRIFGAYSNASNTATVTADLRMSDGISTKIIYAFLREGNGGSQSETFDIVVYLGTGESISANTNDTAVQIAGCSRQIATSDGTLVDPSGYPI